MDCESRSGLVIWAPLLLVITMAAACGNSGQAASSAGGAGGQSGATSGNGGGGAGGGGGSSGVVPCNEAAEGEACQSGPYYCCGKEMTYPACCDGHKQGTCFHYGGVTDDCSGPGEMVEGKDICAHCCQPLQRLEPLALMPDGNGNMTCVSTAPPSLFVCVQCGDGMCGPGENSCVCPDDCP